VPFAVFSCAVLIAALVAVLILNISVSSTQYELVQLRGQQVALSQENEALVQRLEDRGAPQNLAAAATKLGMVGSPTFGSIDLETAKVTGAPEAAKEGTVPEALIAAPEVVTAQDAPPAPAPAPVEPEPAPVEPVQEAPAAEVPVPEVASAEVPAPAEAGAAAGELAGELAEELSGTIPGPEQLPTSR
jgi:hypothetical protein